MSQLLDAFPLYTIKVDLSTSFDKKLLKKAYISEKNGISSPCAKSTNKIGDPATIQFICADQSSRSESKTYLCAASACPDAAAFL